MNTFISFLKEKQYNEYVLKELPKNAIEHFDKRTNYHIDLVNKYAKLIHDNTDIQLSPSFLDNVKKHDRSKFYSELYYGYLWINAVYNFKSKYPNNDIKQLADSACFKHYSLEEHHPEHFIDCNDMTPSNIAEMCADWAAMSEELKTSLSEWYINVALKRYKFDREHRNMIENIINFIEKEKLL